MSVCRSQDPWARYCADLLPRQYDRYQTDLNEIRGRRHSCHAEDKGRAYQPNTDAKNDSFLPQPERRQCRPIVGRIKR
jgi:hypothetical protein